MAKTPKATSGDISSVATAAVGQVEIGVSEPKSLLLEEDPPPTLQELQGLELAIFLANRAAFRELVQSLDPTDSTVTFIAPDVSSPFFPVPLTNEPEPPTDLSDFPPVEPVPEPEPPIEPQPLPPPVELPPPPPFPDLPSFEPPPPPEPEE